MNIVIAHFNLVNFYFSSKNIINYLREKYYTNHFVESQTSIVKLVLVYWAYYIQFCRFNKIYKMPTKISDYSWSTSLITILES